VQFLAAVSMCGSGGNISKATDLYLAAHRHSKIVVAYRHQSEMYEFDGCRIPARGIVSSQIMYLRHIVGHFGNQLIDRER